MKRILPIIFLYIFFSSPLLAQKTVVINKWNEGRNIDYLEINSNHKYGDLSSFNIKTVYTDQQEVELDGGYHVSISSFIMNCSEKKFKLNKTYYFNHDKLVKYSNFDNQYYRDVPGHGWKDVDTDKNQIKVFEIVCK